MQIEKNKVVQFHYTLKDLTGKELETTQGEDPVAYLHGHNNMLVGVEEQLNGKSAGEQLSFNLAATDAYGERQEGLTQRVPIKHLQGAKKWQKGMFAQVQTKDGPRQVTVLKVGKFMADVDFNHPYAGIDLEFTIEIIDVRDATEEEIAHGHAHGVGGHHH